MDPEHPLDDAARAALAREVAAVGVAPVARALGVGRTALTSVLARTARAGTEAIVALRYAERAEPVSR